MSDKDRKEIEEAVREDLETNKYPNFLQKLLNDFLDSLKQKYAKKRKVVEENEELREERDEVFGENLTTIQEKKEKRNQLLMKRAILFFFIIPVIIFIVKILFSAWTMYHQDVEKEKRQALENEKKWSKDVEFNGNLEDAWRTTQVASVNQLKKQVKQITYDLNHTVSEGFADIKDQMLISNKKTNDSIEKVSEKFKAFQNETNKKIEIVEEKNKLLLNKLRDDFPKTVNQKIKQNQKEIVKLPPLKSGGNFSTPSNTTAKSNTTDELIQSVSKILPSFGDEKKQPTEYVYKEVSYDVDLKDNNYSTFVDMVDEKKDSIEDLTFTVQTGFAQGTIINGVSAPTFQYGKNEPEPIFISLDSLSEIANTFTEDMEDCIILGTAIGDFGTGRAKIRMSKISCSLQNGEDDKMYYIDSPIDGWVFSEDGKTGLKGRVITQEGKIISKALPLGLLQGLIATLAATPTLLNGNISAASTTQNQNPSNVLGAAALSGINDGSTKIISKIADYYIELLDALNPIVEIRNGRKVTLAFKGGEKLKLTPYKPVDVQYFEEKEGEDD